MAIKVSQAFERTSANPIDASVALTKAQMLTVNDNLMPDYYFTICQDDGYIYLYDKSATPTATTGKFTKFEGSGGGGGGTAGSTYTGTLLASGWNSTTKQQTVTFTGYSDSYNGVIGVPSDATDAQREEYANSRIHVVSQTGATVTFEAEEIPTINLPVLIYCGGGSGSGVPSGGTTGQVLAKRSSTDGDVVWKNDVTGHTIVDTDGVSKTQRTKLQFEGLDVTDNSTDDTTEVSSTGLNTDSIDDIASATIPGTMFTGNPFNYSTEEQIVGRWIDGKPIYQKTLQIPVSVFSSTPDTGSGYYSVGVRHNISNLGVTVDLRGQTYGNVVRPVPFAYGANSPDFKYFASLGITESDTGNVFIECGSAFRQSVITKNTYGAYVTIQYTKTTD